MSELTLKIKTAGYVEASIRPARFVQERIQPITRLLEIVHRCKVSLRGWDYPHISRRAPDPMPRIDFIEWESEWDSHLEAFRFYQSGHFLSLRGMSYDWRDQSGLWPRGAGWQRGRELAIEEALFMFAEIFEFAARLSNTDAGDESMEIDVTFAGLRDRQLVVSDPRRGGTLDRPPAQVGEFPQSFRISRGDLLTDPRGFAIVAAQELFRRFGEELRSDLLRDWLSELIRR